MRASEVILVLEIKTEAGFRKSSVSFLSYRIAGLLLLVTGLAFSKPLLEVMNTKPELIDGATAYLMIYLCGSPAL